MESMDGESSDAANVKVRLFVKGYHTWLPEADISSALIKHFSSFGKVQSVIAIGGPTSFSIVNLIGEAAVVENVEKLNGGCECDVEGGCKIVVTRLFPITNGKRTHVLPCGYSVPDFYIQRAMNKAEKAKMAKEPKLMLTRKPEPMKATKKAKKSNGSDANDPKFIGPVTIDVTGYDTSLPEDIIKSLMSEHFSSCGKITKIYFLRGIRDKSVFLEILGDDAKEKALQLNGSDVGGRSILVEAIPPRVIRFKLTPGIARRMAAQNEIIRQQPEPANVVVVEGFDPRLHHDNEIKSALVELFSSCGEMVGVCVHKERSVGLDNKAIVRIRGDGVADKAWKLSGRDVGGWKANVVYCSPSFQKTYHRLPSPSPKRTRK